jgi:4-hydroxybutyrate CoA-transferase
MHERSASDWREHYEKRQTTPREAVEVVKSGDRVVTGHACGEPRLVIDALANRADELKDVEIVHMHTLGEGRYCFPEYGDSFRFNGLFLSPATRKAVWEGRADYTPCYFHQVPRLFQDGTLPVDVAMIVVSLPGADGTVSLGISVDYTICAARAAKVVIAEVNPRMPRTGPESRLPVADIDHFIPSDRPLFTITPPVIGEVEKRIGGHIAELIEDGDCLQLGIGAIPDAVLGFLGDKKDLGIHTEMISDGVMHLVEKGVITGARKTIHPGKIVITFVMGTEQLYRWLDGNPIIDAHPVDYTNDPMVVARNDNMVAVNSSISVDLLGQASSESIGPRQFSGVGGQVDFIRGAAASKGGRSIIALPATARDGEVSRIVAGIEPGQAVTPSRNDVDFVVTEYGVATLRGRTMRERARALIAVAAPAFRESLERECRSLYGWL